MSQAKIFVQLFNDADGVYDWNHAITNAAHSIVQGYGGGMIHDGEEGRITEEGYDTDDVGDQVGHWTIFVPSDMQLDKGSVVLITINDADGISSFAGAGAVMYVAEHFDTDSGEIFMFGHTIGKWEYLTEN